MNGAMLQSLTDLHRNIDSGRGIARPKGSKSSTRRRRRTSSGTSDSEESSGIPVLLPIKEKERDTTGIALEMNSRKLNLLHLMVK